MILSSNFIKRKAFLFLILAGCCSQLSFGQFTVTSAYFKNPQLMVDYADNCAKFWKKVHDTTYGGFYVEVGKQANVLNNNKKSLISQSRDAYGFSRAYMLTGNPEYLDLAKSAIQFMKDHLYDTQFGGWYARTDRVGNNPYTGSKSAFDQHYALLGLMANYEATGDTSVFNLYSKGHDFIERSFWDSDSTKYGYFDSVDRSGANGKGKSFNSTVDAITTHLYNMYLITNDEKYLIRLKQVAQNMLSYLEGNMNNQVIGFPEAFNTDWTIDNTQKRTIMGHILKTGWCLARIYKLDPKEEYLVAAKKLVNHVLEKGYDHVNGGPYKDYDRTTGTMMMYGALDKAKAWWQMEQAITSGLMLYEITSDFKYLKMSDESLDFFMKYFVDPQYGEVYADRAETGGRVRTSGGGFWDENKGSESKAAYHSIETAYYSFMYGKLIVNNQPFNLYYNFQPLDSTRVFRMTPVEVEYADFKISEVIKDGDTYNTFDADARLLTVPSGVGGKFAVTYTSTKTYVATSTNQTNFKNLSISLDVYPNPIENSAKIKVFVPGGNNFKVNIYDLNGRLVDQFESFSNGNLNQEIDWQTQSIPNKGIYMIQLICNENVITKKVSIM